LVNGIKKRYQYRATGVKFHVTLTRPLGRKSLSTVLLDSITAEVLGFLPIDSF